MKIRPLALQELKPALDLVWTVFLEFEAPDFSEQGVKTFRNYIRLESMEKLMENEEIKFWGSFEAERLTGVAGVKQDKHISMLFVDPVFHRRGIATALFKEAFAKHKGTITVNSSPYALAFYHRLGFVDQSEEKTIDGIRFTPMKMEK